MHTMFIHIAPLNNINRSSTLHTISHKSTHTGHNIARVVAYITGSHNYVVKRKRSALSKYDISSSQITLGEA